MTTISVKFRRSAVEKQADRGDEKARSGYGSVYYQIVYKRRVARIASGYRLTGEEWLLLRSAGATRGALRRVSVGISFDLQLLRRIDSWMQMRPTPYSVEDVSAEFRRIDDAMRLEGFASSAISRLRQEGRIRTAETYHAAVASFCRYWQSTGSRREPRIDWLTADDIDEYNHWLKSRGVTSNTVSFYNRVLRAIYNRALDAEAVVENRRPFRHAYTGIGSTAKRAIPLEAVSRIASLDLTARPALDYARDMFILSFSLRGMSFVDMAFLRKSDLRDGRLEYRRRKTGQRLQIEWIPQMQRAVDKYPPNQTEYLLPIIRRDGCDERCVYRNAAYNINRSLKTIGRMAGVSIPLTLYSARHSWASAALAKGVPLSVISKGMGHDSERTTRIYLAQFDTSSVDRANAMILDSLNQ